MRKLFISFLLIFTTFSVYAQQAIILSGTVYNETTKKPVEFATVMIVEARKKVYTDSKGNFRLNVEKPGTYTLLIRAEGLKPLNNKIVLNKNINESYFLEVPTVRGKTLTVTAKKEKQTVSRRTMSRQDMKETPATFGDSVGALTSLPGVNRTSGFFGPLVIRGMYPDNNMYYIDGMPLNNPMHFMGLHSVVSNDIMEEIDLYSSSFPVEFGNASAAIINITTIDSVEEFEGVVDIGLLSSAIALKFPVTKEDMVDDKIQKVNNGYLFVSGRIGYLSVFIPRIMDLFGQHIDLLADYGDYQIKYKTYFTKNLAFKILALGAYDRFYIDTEDLVDPDEGADPLVQDLEFSTDTMFHNIGGYLDYKKGKLTNELMTYFSMTESDTYVKSRSEDSPDWLKNYEISSKPYIASVKDTLKYEYVKRKAEIETSLAYTYYYFVVDGKIFNVTNAANPNFDPYTDITLDDYYEKASNQTFTGYTNHKLKLAGMKLNTGIRYEYLSRTSEWIIDPRMMASFEFASKTTISYAGGKYSQFIQTNPFYFNFNPNFSLAGDYVDPIEAYHNVLGVEQIADLYTFSIEGYYNKFNNMPAAYTYEKDGETRYGMSLGENIVYGFEIMARKDSRENSNGLFGWLSYTFNKSKERSGIKDPGFGDPNWDEYKTSQQQVDHSTKLVLGYRLGQYTFSGRFQVYSGDYYTPIVDDDGGLFLPSGITRYGEVYSADPNSKQLDWQHRLDLRYSYQANYKWGHIKWYIEVIDVYSPFYKEKSGEEWRYDKPYGDDNPKIEEESAFALLPNFGVEIVF